MGDNYTKAEVEKKRKDNIRKFGLSCDYYMNLNPPKAKTKEWLKVLTIDQILRDRTRFSVSQKIHQLEILKIALKKKLKATLKFKVYKNCHIGIVINKIDKSIHEHDAEYEFEETTYVENKAMQRLKEFQTKLNTERARKTNEVKIDTAKRILGGDQFSY